MKPTRALLTLLAATLLCPSIRAQDEKPAPPKDSGPATQTDETDETDVPKKKERPMRSQAAPDKPAPRLKPDDRPDGRPPTWPVEAVSKRTWIGISTQPVDPSLREHLEIAEGFGIQVVEVSPDSPAAQAGLRANDIIIRFEDQRLISPEHLSILVRAKTSGEKAPLSLIRKGKEETVEVTLGEADENVFGPFGDPSQMPHGFMTPPQAQDNRRRVQDEILRQQQDYWQDWMEKNRPNWRGQDQEPPTPPVNPGHPREKSENKPDRRPPGVSVNPGFPLRVFGTEGVLNIDNEEGELTLTRKNEKHDLVIKDAEGKVVYEGPFDPEKGVEGLPENARKQLETMKLGNLEIRLPDPPAETPEKTSEPKEGRSKDGESPGEIL